MSLSVDNLTPADIFDSAGAQTILNVIRKRRPKSKHFFAVPMTALS